MSVRGFNTGSGIEQYDYDYLDNKPDAPTKESIGLGNVDNTSDMDKPVSTEQAQALSQKVDKVPGMGLSQEDYTSAEKEKLGDLPTNEELEADLAGKASAESVTSLNQAITEIVDDNYTYEALPVDTTANGWRLEESNGLCSENTDFQLVKYRVTAGDRIKAVASDRFQFQTVASVPSYGTSNRVGVTYGAGTYYLVVPETATYLIFSAEVNGGVANAYSKTPVVDILSDKIDDVDRQISDLYLLLDPSLLANGVWENPKKWSAWSQRLSTRNLIPVKAGEVVSLQTNSLMARIQMYVGDSTSLTTITDWGYYTDETFFTIPGDGELQFSFRKQDSGSINVAEYDAITKMYTTFAGKQDIALHKLIDDTQQEYKEFNVYDFVVGNWENRSRTTYNRRLCTINLYPVHAGDMLVYDSRTLMLSVAIYIGDATTSVNVVQYETTSYEKKVYVPADGLLFIQLKANPDRVITIADYDVTTLRLYNSIRGSITSINTRGSNIQERAFVSSYNLIEWEAHARNFSEMFNNVNNADAFLFFTDCHIMHMPDDASRRNLLWKPRFRNAISYIEQLFYATPCNTLLNGGDWLGSYDSQEQALYMLSYINGAMRAKFKDHFVMAVGNHDTNYQGSLVEGSGQYDARLSQGAVNATYCSGFDKSYYLHHAPTYDIYCFDTGIESSDLTSSYYTDQVKWFAKALETNETAHIVIFLHMIYKSGTTVGAMFNQLSLCAKAFNSKASYTYDGVTYNYANTSGKVAFAIGGHTHRDTIVTINDIPCVITKNASGYSDFTTLPLDLCMIDWDNAKLYLYRAEIGASSGETREMPIIV